MDDGENPLPTYVMYTKFRIVPGKDRDEESGKYTTSYQDSDFIEAIQQLNNMAGTSDIADRIGCTRRTAYTRLKSLEDDGQVESRKVGNSLVWATR